MNCLLMLACVLSPNDTNLEAAKNEPEAALFSTTALVTAIDHVDVPARQPGVMAKLSLRRGASIEKDQLLAKLDNRRAFFNYEVARQETQIAKQQAENKLPTKLKKTIAKYATREYEMNESLFRNSRGAVSQLQLQTSKSAMEQAIIDSENSVAEEKQLDMSLHAQIQKEQLAKLELENCEIIAPLNGIVSDIHRRPGEWVNTGDPIVTMVRMDRLRIETLMHPSEITPQQIISCRARVQIQISEDEHYVVPESRIFIAGAEIEPDGRYLIAVEIENEFATDHLNQKSWLVRPGMTAQVDILPPLEAAEPLKRPDISFPGF